MSDGWTYTRWTKHMTAHLGNRARSTDVMEVKGWVWCGRENRCHVDRRPTACTGFHYLLLRTASAPGLHIGKHEVRTPLVQPDTRVSGKRKGKHEVVAVRDKTR